MKVCASNPIASEFSLCRMAFDAPDTENDCEPFEFAEEVRKSVNCEACKIVVKGIFETYTPTGRLKKE